MMSIGTRKVMIRNDFFLTLLKYSLFMISSVLFIMN